MNKKALIKNKKRKRKNQKTQYLQTHEFEDGHKTINLKKITAIQGEAGSSQHFLMNVRGTFSIQCRAACNLHLTYRFEKNAKKKTDKQDRNDTEKETQNWRQGQGEDKKNHSSATPRAISSSPMALEKQKSTPCTWPTPHRNDNLSSFSTTFCCCFEKKKQKG